MLRYRDGDAAAFALLYERHKGPLYRYLARLLAGQAAVDELFQDVWLRLVQARDRYQPTAVFRTYLFSIAHNRAMDHFRRLRHPAGGDTADELADDALADQRQLPVSELLHNQRCLQRLLQLLQTLPVAQRDTFLLREEAGLGLQEIADLQACGVEAVKSRLRYALHKLRAGLREFIP